MQSTGAPLVQCTPLVGGSRPSGRSLVPAPAAPLRNKLLARCQAADDWSAVTLDAVLVSRRELGLAAAAAGLTLAGQAGAQEGAGCVFTTAPNGLEYCDVREGDGAAPAKGSLIRAHYTGRLASNNAKFDSSYDRGRPLSFKVGVGEVIRGWDTGILGNEELGIPPMKEGGRRILRIPPELGYGARSVGPIPANSTLLFEVDLLGRR